jgi:hypothetical protein
MSVRFAWAPLVFLCSGCAGSVASSPQTLYVARVEPAPAVMPAEGTGTQPDPSLLASCQDSTGAAELRLAWSTRANGTRSLAGDASARHVAAQPRAPECLALGGSSVDRE